jgi:hypothetical protein
MRASIVVSLATSKSSAIPTEGAPPHLSPRPRRGSRQEASLPGARYGMVLDSHGVQEPSQNPPTRQSFTPDDTVIVLPVHGRLVLNEEGLGPAQITAIPPQFRVMSSGGRASASSR